MMTYKQLLASVGILTLTVFGLATANWIYNPERASAWIAAIVFMPIVLVVISIIERARPLETYSTEKHTYFTRSVLIACLMIVGSLTMRLLNVLEILEITMIERITGLALGALLIFMGNLTPKLLGPISEMKCDAETTQSLKRFTGISFVTAGIGYMLAWIALPVERANSVAMTICLAAVILVVARCLWAFRTQGTGPSNLSPD